MSYQNSWKKSGKLLLSITALTAAFSAHAITLDDALLSAYDNNYQLKAESENYKATRMNIPKAAAGFLPSAEFARSKIRTKYDTRLENILRTNRNQLQNTLSISQPIFNGGQTIAQTGKAWYATEGEFQNYRSIMNQVSLDTVQAYENVLATEEIYNINVDNEKNFKQYLEYTKIRFDAGVVTRTDVLQSEVKLAEATANKEKSYADMLNSRATFQRLIGFMPEDKMESVDLNKVVLPKDVAEFRDIAFNANPNLLAADSNQTTAKFDLGVSSSRILPSAGVTAQKTRSNSPKDTNNTDGTTVMLKLTVPIFQNGSEYADIGEKAYMKEKAKYDYLETERKLEEAVISYWNKYISSKYSLQFRRDGVDAAKLALDGVREEVNIGTKTTIDLLNAESDYFNAKVSLRTTQRDLVVATYQVLQIMGQLDIL